MGGGRSNRARSPTCSGRRTRTSLRAATTRARMHCSKRSPAACRPRTATAGGTPSSSVRGGSRFGRTRSWGGRTGSPHRRARRAPGGDLDPVARVELRTATSKCSACGRPPRLPRPMENYLRRGVRGARFRVGEARSTAPRSLARTTCSTCRTRGPRRPGSAPRRSRIHSTSGSTRRSWPRRAPSSSSRPGTYRGGSAFFLASICDLLGVGRGRLDRRRAGRATTTRRIRGSPTSAAAPRSTRTSWPRSARARRGSARS